MARADISFGLSLGNRVATQGKKGHNPVQPKVIRATDTNCACSCWGEAARVRSYWGEGRNVMWRILRLAVAPTVFILGLMPAQTKADPTIPLGLIFDDAVGVIHPRPSGSTAETDYGP